MRKVLPILMIIHLLCITSFAQTAKKTATVKGKIINRITKTFFNDVKVTIPELNTVTTSEGEGNFTISEVPMGKYTVVIGGTNAKRDSLVVVVDKDIVDMGDITVEPVVGDVSETSNDIPTIAIEENTTQEDENTSSVSQSSSGFYVANADPFLRVAAITFGTYRFRPRGYDNTDVQVNGMPLQDLESGYSSYTLVGGLNDVFRNRNITYGLKPSDFTFGTAKGSTYIDATAADQRAGTEVSYFNSNRSFRNRVMVTHSTGIMKNGWAFSASVSKRWAKEGYVPGTFYDAYGFYAAASKLTKKGQFNLTAFGAPTRRGKQSTAQDEVFGLTGDHYYNADWGYQNGEKRNGYVNDVFQPVIVANYTYRPNDRTRWNTALGYEFGKNKNSTIDYYNGYSPNPIYYHNLPSYYLYSNNPAPWMAADVNSYISANQGVLQVDWNGMYQANYTNISTVPNGTSGGMFTGRQSIYAVANDVDDVRKFVFNTNIEHALNKHISLFGGVQVINQQDEYYRQMADLLGGDFFANLNQFAVQQSIGVVTYNQNNLKDPNHLVHVGDKYSYDYKLNVLKSTAWGQATFSYNKLYAFVAAEGGMTSFFREGLYQNGLFPDNSYGKSATHSFATYRVKGGVTYNINLRNAVYLNAGYFTDAPSVDNTYISDRTRDFVVSHPEQVKTKTAEVGYLLKTTPVTLRLSGYVNDVTDNTVIKRFFNDDPAFQTFVNYVMQNVNTRSTGLELAATARIMQGLTATAVAAVGQYFYTDRPDVTVYYDNDPSKTNVTRQVYIKNYYVGAGPQSVYSLDFSYQGGRKWRANINFNYMDRNYVEVNPDRRTQEATDLVVPNSTQWHQVIDQEKLPAAFTVDVSGARTFDVSHYFKKVNKRRTLLVINGGITNLLNNQDIKMMGYEQLRFDFTNKNPNRFPNRYAYAFGINYFINLSLRF